MRKWIVLVFCIAIALLNLFIFGMHHIRSWGDASQYDGYALNLLAGNGYTLDGTNFNAIREPGYPAFLAALYWIFGRDNFLIVSIIQALLVAAIAFCIYRLFARAGEEWWGMGAALIISAIPYYGFYSYEILTEIPFAFILALLFYMCVRTASGPEQAPWYAFALIGALCAIGTLIRTQLLFFLPFLLICYTVFIRIWSPRIGKHMLIACALFAAGVLPWMLYVHSQTGSFAVTTGRQEETLYIRADRAALSYADNTRYALDWLKRSTTGGVSSDFLENNDFHKLQMRYGTLATTTAAIELIRKQSIATILSNPGHYFYGNLIEVMKTLYIEHDYSDSMSKYLRAAVYIFLYGSTIFGVAMLWLRRGLSSPVKLFAYTAIAFIFYNTAILSFFDTIPRYNTPYLFFYLIIGCGGFVLAKPLWRKA